MRDYTIWPLQHKPLHAHAEEGNLKLAKGVRPSRAFLEGGWDAPLPTVCRLAEVSTVR